MRIFRCVAIVAALLFVSGLAVRADEKSHRAAAKELLEVADAEKTMQATIDQMLELQLKSQPQLAPFRDVMRKFLTKHLGFESVKDELVKLYTEEFTEAELKEIVAFYRTPTGKKTIEKLPKLTARGAQIGMERVKANQAELRMMIEEEIKKQRDKQ